MEIPSKGHKTALLIIDMINDLEFEDGTLLFNDAYLAAKAIANLKKHAKQKGLPIIYVNDNYGKWQSNFRHIVDYCLENDVRGKPLAKLLEPADDDYFVLKPKFSGFFATPLDLLLQHLQVSNLILTGVAGNMCVQFTANDAYMRDYSLFVPEDCIASNTPETNAEALHLMRDVLKADITRSTEMSFSYK
ncbi:cysteine hydrolase family protein [Bacillus solitudinis]|uniref:cysteine hydrolase family protein n=1 Tax=Bacillus solitudinis TaxID=2014074 RepID=UPI000C24BE83|nr:isochorismatase family cysteine hydrolase [Bacillus solitudinis]